MSSGPLLEVHGLSQHFRTRRGIFASRKAPVLRAVDGVSFSVRRGEAFGIVGESGSGKSSLVRTILRLHDPTAGRIVFDGADITVRDQAELRPLRRHLQMVFQDTKSSLDPRMTIARILQEPLVTHALSRERADLVRLLGLVGLTELHLDRFPHQLSGGQRQRVGIARVLALEPRLIVADEPVSALDVSVQAQILNLLKELQRRLGVAILLISHDISVVGYFCDRVAVMYLGRIVELGPARHVTRTPSHPYAQALISAVPGMRQAGQDGRIVLRGELPSPLRPPSGCPFHTRCHRKIGPICEEQVPVPRPTAEGGWAACHLIPAPGDAP